MKYALFCYDDVLMFLHDRNLNHFGDIFHSSGDGRKSNECGRHKSFPSIKPTLRSFHLQLQSLSTPRITKNPGEELHQEHHDKLWFLTDMSVRDLREPTTPVDPCDIRYKDF